MKPLLQALGTVLLVCLGVRLAAILIAPVLPLLGGLVVLAAVAAWLFSRHGPSGFR